MIATVLIFATMLKSASCRKRVLLLFAFLSTILAVKYFGISLLLGYSAKSSVLEEIHEFSGDYLHVLHASSPQGPKKTLTIVFHMNILPPDAGGLLGIFDSITHFLLAKIDRPIRIVAASEARKRPQNDSLHVYRFEPDPKTLFADLKAKGLVNQGAYHLGDGRFIYDVSYYNQATYVFRNHYNSEYFARFPHAHYIPLGMKDGFGLIPPATLLPASKRRLSANFIGTLGTNPNRAEMVEKIRSRNIPVYFSIEHSYGSKDAMHIIDYRNILRESIFTFAPYGYHTESMRLFEALEAGSIPIFQRHNASRSPLTPMGPDVPIPQFDTWDKAADYVVRMSNDAQALDDLQRHCIQFWKSYKVQLQTHFKSVIDSAFERSHGYKC